MKSKCRAGTWYKGQSSYTQSYVYLDRNMEPLLTELIPLQYQRQRKCFLVFFLEDSASDFFFLLFVLIYFSCTGKYIVYITRERSCIDCHYIMHY